MQINDLLNNYNNQTMQTSQPTGKAEVAQAVNRMVSSLMELPAGSVFEGSINSVKNGVVSLGLSNGGTIQARLDNGITLNQGDTYFFEVKSNSQGQLAIRPYEGNIMGNPILSNALSMAGLPITGKNLTMVQSMMDNGMSIDKNALFQMAQTLANVPDTTVTSAVTMQKLGIPVNEVNLNEFVNYSTDKHEITTQLNDLVRSLPMAIESGQMDVDDMVKLAKVFFESGETATSETATPETAVEVAAEGTIVSEGQKTVETMVQAPTIEQVETVILHEQTNQSAAAAENVVTASIEGSNELTQPDKINIQNDEPAQVNNATAKETPEAEKGVAAKETEGTVLSDSSKSVADGIEKEFPELMKQLSEITGKQYDSGTDIQTLKSEIAALLNDDSVSKKDIAKLLTGKDFQKLFSELLDKDWAIKPDEVRDKDKVKNLYDKLDKQLEQVDRLLKSMNPETVKNLSESVTKVRDNIQFMNDINNAYTFVQIPLKMSGKNVNSDLYVMTNKKNLMEKDREITAYLHLDMEHLGSTDVFIKMYQKNVTTNFFLEDDKSYDLIEKNLPILEKKLEGLGYSVTLNLKNEKKEIDFVEDFLKKEAGAETPKIHRYSFDVKA